MKLTDKRFWILLIVLTHTAVVSAQTYFSVEKISETEFIKAEKEFLRYNIIPTDSIVDNDIVNVVLKEAQNKFERLDSVTRQGIYDSMLGWDIELMFTKKLLLFLPELKLYGFIVYYEPYDDNIWWFNGDSGEYICRAPYPSAINKNGMYVSQPEKDCDFVLDLQFFRYNGNNIFEYGTDQNTDLKIQSYLLVC